MQWETHYHSRTWIRVTGIEGDREDLSVYLNAEWIVSVAEHRDKGSFITLKNGVHAHAHVRESVEEVMNLIRKRR